MPLDQKTTETIAVNGQLYRRAFADAVAKAINNNPEGLVAEDGPDRVIGYFVSACCEWMHRIEHLREWLKRTLGERSAAYLSIPDLFTKG